MIYLGPCASIAGLIDYLLLRLSEVFAASDASNGHVALDSYCRNGVAYLGSFYCYRPDLMSDDVTYYCFVGLYGSHFRHHCDCDVANVMMIQMICGHLVPMFGPHIQRYDDWMTTALWSLHEL